MKYFLILLLVINVASGVRINEVMYNPEGEDNNKEFIEIYGAGNLTDYTIGDFNSNDTLELIQFSDSNYSLIIEEGYNYSGVNASIYSAGGLIGNGLGNSGDTIFLYFNNTLLDSLSYDGILANSNDFSLEYLEGEYVESKVKGGTPGRENSVVNEVKENITNPVSNNTCNISLDLVLDDKLFYNEGETIFFRNVASDESSNYSVEYYITDIFNKEVRKKKTTKNSKPKQFTPEIFESDQSYIIRNELFVDCENTAEKTRNERIIILKGNNPDSCSQSFLCETHLSRIQSLESKITKERGASFSSSGKSSIKLVNITKRKQEISSFYTRKKRFDPEIKLFAKIDAKGIYVLKLTSHLEEFNLTLILNESETIELEVNASEGRNLYLLELISNNKVADFEKLVIEFEQEKVEEKNNVLLIQEENKEAIIDSEKEEINEVDVAYENKVNYAPFLIILCSLGVIFLFKNKLYKVLSANFFYGEERDPGKDSEWMDQSEHDLRANWQS